ncbi:MAG: hypothetical protein ACI8X5_000055 [Planctomycetota bacterium]|jgi:hypothetical protein
MSPWIPEHPKCVAEGLSPELRCQSRVLHIEGETLYASRGLELVTSLDGGNTFQTVARAPGDLIERTLARDSLAERILRTGIQGIVPLPSGDLIANVRGSMLFLARGEDRFTFAHRIGRGKQPVGLCVHPSGRTYFGENFPNPGREEVHIYGSESGQEWDIVGTFPENLLRSIHRIVWDPFRKGMWVLTAGDKSETGLWWTTDEFRTLEPILDGETSAKATTLLPLESGLILAMDSPDETNYIQHFDPQTGELESLAPTSGRVLNSARSNGLWLLSTTVQNRSVPGDQSPVLYASPNGHDWSLVTRFTRDLHGLDRSGRIFKTPTALLPTGDSALKTVFACGQALKSAHGTLMAWTEADILEQIGS